LVKAKGPEGRYYQLRLVKTGVQLDIFLAASDNWGWILLMRTGSGEFSEAMLSRWKRVQGLGPTQDGSVDGRLVRGTGSQEPGAPVPTPEEEDVFRLCRVPFIAPEQRIGREALRVAGEGGG
jgi:DNA polymerase/3'-5' exonuclease PolX